MMKIVNWDDDYDELLVMQQYIYISWKEMVLLINDHIGVLLITGTGIRFTRASIFPTFTRQPAARVRSVRREAGPWWVAFYGCKSLWMQIILNANHFGCKSLWMQILVDANHWGCKSSFMMMTIVLMTVAVMMPMMLLHRRVFGSCLNDINFF